MTAEAEEFSEILPSVTIPGAEGLWCLWHLCELLGFSTCPQNTHRNRRVPAPFHRGRTVAFTLPVAMQPRWSTENDNCIWNHRLRKPEQTEQSVSLPHARCHRPVVHKHLPIFFSLLCLEVLLRCMESWVGFKIWFWKASREMAFTISEMGPSFTITIAPKCVSQQQWNCHKP